MFSSYQSYEYRKEYLGLYVCIYNDCVFKVYSLSVE